MLKPNLNSIGGHTGSFKAGGRFVHLNVQPDMNMAQKVWENVSWAGEKVLKPVNVVYKAAGGSFVNQIAGRTYQTVKSVGDVLEWTSDKISDATTYGIEMGKEVGRGTLKATVGSAYEAGMAMPRDIGRNLWNVPKETTKTMGSMGAAPWRFGEGIVQGAVGLFKRPIAMAKKLLHLDMKGAATEVRGLVSDVLAPISKPGMPILKGIGNTLKEGLLSKWEYVKGLRNAALSTRDGVKHVFTQAHDIASQKVAEAQAKRVIERREEIAKVLQEKEATEAAKKQGAKGAGKRGR